LIERYIEVIEDLYKLIEKITGTKINHDCLEILKKDKEKIMKYDETNQKLINLNNMNKENTPGNFIYNNSSYKKQKC
jgi:hypothetical protein